MAAKRRKGGWSGTITVAGRVRKARDLESGVFTLGDPKEIVLSLRRSARVSQRSKDGQYRWAMSMLNLYLNRAGRNVDSRRRRVLEDAKAELRRAFGRETTSG